MNKESSVIASDLHTPTESPPQQNCYCTRPHTQDRQTNTNFTFAEDEKANKLNYYDFKAVLQFVAQSNQISISMIFFGQWKSLFLVFLFCFLDSEVIHGQHPRMLSLPGPLIRRCPVLPSAPGSSVAWRWATM